MAPNSGGQLRTHMSQVMHSDDSMRRGGFFQAWLRDRVTIRWDRSIRASVEVSLPQGKSALHVLGAYSSNPQ
jgi:hypothetical protein